MCVYACVPGRCVQVNWRAVHFKQPGKLNKMLPWEEFEMEKALAEEAERQASGQGRQSRECTHRAGPQGPHGTHVLHERPGLRGW